MDSINKAQNGVANAHGVHPGQNGIKNNNNNSDGEDDDDDMEEDNQSPHSRSPEGSTSEQSLTSPAGFSSLPSLGSPNSVASPSDPGISGHLPPGPGGASNGADWYRPSGHGAFKPPSASTSGSLPPGPPPSGSGLYHQQQMYHQHAMAAAAAAHAAQMNNRPPVGKDPRDCMNPLSVSQLTGSSHCNAPGAPGVPMGPPGVPAQADKRALPLMT